MLPKGVRVRGRCQRPVVKTRHTGSGPSREVCGGKGQKPHKPRPPPVPKRAPHASQKAWWQRSTGPGRRNERARPQAPSPFRWMAHRSFGAEQSRAGRSNLNVNTTWGHSASLLHNSWVRTNKNCMSGLHMYLAGRGGEGAVHWNPKGEESTRRGSALGIRDCSLRWRQRWKRLESPFSFWGRFLRSTRKG